MRGSGGGANRNGLKDAAPETLAALRAEIDALDDALHDALMRRAAVVERLARSGAKPREAVLRPGREAAILRRLLARHAGALPKPALVRVWREIFATSLAQQAGFSIAVHRWAREEALNHFGPSFDLRTSDTPLTDVLACRASLAVVPLHGDWWAVHTARYLPVVALLPVTARRHRHTACVVARVPADPSGVDITLFRSAGHPGGAIVAGPRNGLLLQSLRGYWPAVEGADLIGHGALMEMEP